MTLRVKVSDDRGFRVSGVQVRAHADGSPRGLGRARTTASPTAGPTFTFRATGTGTTYVFVEARREGREGRRAGISTSNLFRVRVH